MKEKFRELPNYGEQKHLLLQRAITVVEEYQEQGFTLTLRQLYYQAVARNWIENTEKSYKAFGVIIGEGRLAGFIDWNAIEDRTRETIVPQSFNSIEEFIQIAIRSFRADRMKEQDTYIEVLIEKEALAGIIAPITGHYGIPLTPTKGDPSITIRKELYGRIREQIQKKKQVVLLVLGDLDPKGVQIPISLNNKLVEMHGGQQWIMERVALSLEQVKEVNAPPQPAKKSDSTYTKFVDKYGKQSWELDALSPDYLQTLVKNEIENRIDTRFFQEVLDQEKNDIVELRNKLK